MSNSPNDHDRPAGTRDHATEIVGSPASGVPSPGSADQTGELPGVNATGEYLAPASGAADPGQTCDSVPPVPHMTEVASAAEFAAAAPMKPPDVTSLGGTGIYEPPDPGATGAYHPDSTGAPPNDPTLNPHSINQDGTGLFVPSGTVDHVPSSAGADLSGATGAFDPTAPSVFNEAARSPKQNRAVPDAPLCGRYFLKRFHAKGGMGEIWLAEDPAIGRSVALKRMLGQPSGPAAPVPRRGPGHGPAGASGHRAGS